MKKFLRACGTVAFVTLFIACLCSIVGVWTVFAATPPPDLHCPSGWIVKYEGNYNSTVLAAGTEFCVKAATNNSGKLIADGTTSLYDYVTWLNNGGQHPDVSYYVVYSRPTPPPCDEEECPPPPPPPTPPPPPVCTPYNVGTWYECNVTGNSTYTATSANKCWCQGLTGRVHYHTTYDCGKTYVEEGNWDDAPDWLGYYKAPACYIGGC